VETGDESLKLLLDTLLDSPFCDEPTGVSMSLGLDGILYLLDVFALVLVCDLDLFTTWL
jgi:hypothetical protein